jgi:hypothetical protein
MNMAVLFPNSEPKEVQARKRKRYIWTTGVLGWGGGMFLVTTLYETLYEWYQAGYIHIPSARPLLWSIIPNLIIWPIAGNWFGATVWKNRSDPED